MANDRTANLRVKISAQMAELQKSVAETKSEIQSLTQLVEAGNRGPWQLAEQVWSNVAESLGVSKEQLGLLTAGITAAVTAITTIIVKVNEWSRELDDLNKQAALAGMTLSEFNSLNFRGTLQGIDGASNQVQRYVQSINGAVTGNIRAAAALRELGLSFDDLRPELGDVERFERFLDAVDRSGPKASRAIQELGMDFREITALASQNETALYRQLRALNELDERFGSAADNAAALRNEMAVLDEVAKSVRATFQGLFSDDFALALKLINVYLVQLLTNFRIFGSVLKSMAEQALGPLARVWAILREINMWFQNQAGPDQQGTPFPSVLMNAPAGGAVSMERGGFSAVQAALRGESMLGLMRQNVEANRETAENTREGEAGFNAGESASKAWAQTENVGFNAGLIGRAIYGMRGGGKVVR